MSDISFMEKLLDGVEVEWKALGEVGDFIRGSGIQKSDFTASGAGCTRMTERETLFTYHFPIEATH
jgi:hypothetical protein